jgi:hypothetical protein
MQKKRRFAQDTEVPVSKSRGALEQLLQAAGAGQIVMGSDRPQRIILLMFSLAGRQIKLRASTERPLRRCDVEQLEREAWRGMLFIVKAKLEYIATGESSVEREFLANVVLPDGSTVGDDVLPKLAQAYEHGSLPPLLPA